MLINRWIFGPSKRREVGDLLLGSPRMQRLRVSFDTASGQAADHRWPYKVCGLPWGYWISMDTIWLFMVYLFLKWRFSMAMLNDQMVS